MKPRDPQLDFSPTTRELMRRAVGKFHSKDLIVTPHSRWSYAQIDAASRVLAKRMLAAGIGKGTRVGAQFPFGAHWVVAWLAATRIGALFLPFSTAYKPVELRKVLRIGDVHTFLCPVMMMGTDRHEFVEQTVRGLAAMGKAIATAELPFLRRVWMIGTSDRPWAEAVTIDNAASDPGPVTDAMLEAAESEVKPADLMVVIFTSGTTSDPKGIVHTHGAMVRHGLSNAQSHDLKPADRLYCGMPFFWVGGLAHTLIPALHVGATLMGQEKFEAGEALEIMEREQATIIIGWEGITRPLLTHPLYEARNFPAKHHPLFAPGAPGRIGGLGMTETCGPYSGTSPEERLRNPNRPANCVGRTRPCMERRIVEPESGRVLGEGERGAIHVRGYALTVGLLKRERTEDFDRDGWYNTGDQGYVQDGLLYFTGRLTEMIKTSGNNVSPAEVESALQKCPVVLQAYVAGLPDSQRGEVVAAAIVPAPGTSIDLTQLQSQLKDSLSNYKVPRKFLVLAKEDVPWLATGKVDRLAIKRRLQEEALEPSSTAATCGVDQRAQ